MMERKVRSRRPSSVYQTTQGTVSRRAISRSDRCISCSPQEGHDCARGEMTRAALSDQSHRDANPFEEQLRLFCGIEQSEPIETLFTNGRQVMVFKSLHRQQQVIRRPRCHQEAALTVNNDLWNSRMPGCY